MILADKIIKQRKKNGWSQEELADKMNVSRQAVSKWESAQTIPDIDKIMQLGELFGVTIDYLLKDSIEDEEFADMPEEKPVKKVSLEDANKYLAVQKKNSIMTAIATLLCILSPVVLIILGSFSEQTSNGDIYPVIGLIVMFAFIITAVPMFIACGNRNKPYSFLDKIEPFDLEYGVKGIVEEKKKALADTFKKWTIVGICTSILAPIPLFVGVLTDAMSKEGATEIFPYMVAFSLVIAALATCVFIVVNVRKSAIQKLLREEDYTDLGKKKSQLKNIVSFVYWMVVLVPYLIWSIVAEDWDISWVLLAGAAMLYPVAMTICNYIVDKKENQIK